MKLSSFLILALLQTAFAKPSDVKNSEIYDEIQNDGDEDEYGELEVSEPPGSNVNVNKVSSSNELPKIYTEGQTIVKNLHESVQLPCNATGDFVQTWTKMPKKLLFQGDVSMGKHLKMKQLSDGGLQIDNIDRDDAGEYKCEALVTDTIRPNIIHRLIVQAPPIIEYLEAKNNVTTLQIGDTLVLNCKADGYPQAVIAWDKDDGYRFDITGSQLTIPNVSRHESGVYRCFADNKIGKPDFKAITIKVEHKPIIALERLTVTSKNSESETELKCLVHAEPKATVNWIKDNNNIRNTPNTVLINRENTHVLILKNIEDAAFGDYACSATNYLGNTKKTISFVKTPVVLKFISKKDGKNSVIIFEIQSRTPIIAQELEYRKRGEKDWTKVVPAVSVASDEIYNIQHTFNENLEAGHYEARLKSKNKDGWSEYSTVEQFTEVNAKHGHHKTHKKGHKHGKEKQALPAQETPQTSEAVEVPAEHHESDFIKDASTKGNGCSSLTSSALAVSIISTIAFLNTRLAIRV